MFGPASMRNTSTLRALTRGRSARATAVVPGRLVPGGLAPGGLVPGGLVPGGLLRGGAVPLGWARPEVVRGDVEPGAGSDPSVPPASAGDVLISLLGYAGRPGSTGRTQGRVCRGQPVG